MIPCKMGQEMFYLLRVLQNPTYTQMSESFSEGAEFGLFKLQQGKPPEPVVKPEVPKKVGFDRPADLGIAMGKFFRARDSSIDSIAATEFFELSDIPLRLPHVEWTEPLLLYDRIDGRAYVEIIQAMTKELDGV